MHTTAHRAFATILPIALVITTLLQPGPGACAQMEIGEQATIDEPDTSFASDFLACPDRIWIGPDYWANRLQDWRVRSARIECIEAAANRPVRTLHLLTRSMRAGIGDAALSVRIGAIDRDADRTADQWAGFLIGAGGASIDYRLSAQTHHLPAEDGGMLCVVNGFGEVSFRDFSMLHRAGGSWAINGPLRDGEVAPLEGQKRMMPGREGPLPPSCMLDLTIRVTEIGNELVLRATDPDNGDLLSESIIADIDPALLDGSIALVSHRGPVDSPHGHWFGGWRVSGSLLARHNRRAFGPVICALHTLSNGMLKMTAQFPPLGDRDTPTATLQTWSEAGGWQDADEAEILADSFTAEFRIENWDATRHVPYRILYALKQGGGIRLHAYEGIVRREPVDRETFTIGAFTCVKHYTGQFMWNHNGIWFPHNDWVRAVATHDPDLLYFSGDQVYEGDITPAEGRPFDKAMLDYLCKWYRWCWTFRDLARTRPTITIPDDHDVWHGNIWGAGGVHAQAREGLTAQDAGGYKMSPRFVNAVHRTQSSHLPDPYDPEPAGEISVYYTALEYAGVSFAIVADRQWKSAPAPTLPDADIQNGWSRNADFDPKTQADVAGADMLGQRQEAFLEAWATEDGDGTWMKVICSQSPWANIATLPARANSGSVIPSLPILGMDDYPPDDRPIADFDSNGWPQSARLRAVRAMHAARAIHLNGDQHLATLVQYGLDGYRDGPFSFCVPAIGNTWPRRWFPSQGGANRDAGAPKYTGDFEDGFGNLITVYAVANPHQYGVEPAALYNRAAGYGIVRLNRAEDTITFECWPRWVDPTAPDAKQYLGWPVTIDRETYERIK